MLGKPLVLDNVRRSTSGEQAAQGKKPRIQLWLFGLELFDRFVPFAESF
jgi:hypothetical protein